MQSVRKDAPWCPSNIEFIRRINGLDSVDEVKRIVFEASYVVMGLGDVYLGAPVATPLDPRHRLVTTKYNPARTWTAENSVGIGGSYLCVYGMEGPGGYQFVGRTLQMWNPWRTTTEFTQPWLLRFFDQIKFYEVSADELKQIRRDFPKGQYPLKIETTRFNLKQYNAYLAEHAESIEAFTTKRQQAFDEELQRWIESGQINFETEQHVADDPSMEEVLADHEVAIESHVAGNIWKILVEPGDHIEEGQAVVVLESMKMEIEVTATEAGTVKSITREEGSQVVAGQRLLVMELTS
jgi:urea carboxylase